MSADVNVQPAVPAVFPSPPDQRLRLRKPLRASANQPGNALSRLFWPSVLGLVAAVFYHAPGRSFESIVGALLIIAAAMLPVYLWVYDKARGLPLFPVFALTCTWTYGLPLVAENPIVNLFPGQLQLFGALSVVGVLVCGTAAWYLVVRRPARPPKICWAMNESQSRPLLLSAMVGCILWTMVTSAGLINLPTGIQSVIQAGLIAVEALATFVLSYRLGSGQQSPAEKISFCVLFVLLSFMNTLGLLLIGAMSLFAVTCTAYVIAARRLPWRVCLVGVLIFSALHLGKGEMRERHWREDEQQPVAPWQYPGFFAEWIGYSVHNMLSPKADDERGESLLERASLMHWLLVFQVNTPHNVPFMYGATYAEVPRMFIPRLFDPNKPTSHEATYLLAINYGIQLREDTETTTIAFGLLNEAYANFGFIGMCVLGAILGAAYGKVSHMARGMPILSLRTLFAALLASYCIQSEIESTYYAAALFQSSVVLLVIAAVTMGPRPRNWRTGSLVH